MKLVGVMHSPAREAPPAFGDNPGFSERVEYLAIEKLVAEPGIEALVVVVVRHGCGPPRSRKTRNGWDVPHGDGCRPLRSARSECVSVAGRP